MKFREEFRLLYFLASIVFFLKLINNFLIAEMDIILNSPGYHSNIKLS